MPARLNDIAASKRLLLIVLDGRQFPNARNALRAAGFSGTLHVVTHRDWAALCRGQCDAVVDFPRMDVPRIRIALSLARVLSGEGRRADAICWVAPPRGALKRMVSAYAARKPVFCFYEGRPRLCNFAQEPGLPAIDPKGTEESTLAMRHLLPVLGRATPANPVLRLGVDGDGIHFREATGVQWYRRHLLAELCREEFGLDLRVMSPVAEARSIWETPWSRRMYRIPPALAAYAPPSRADAPPIEAVTGPIDLFHQTFFDPPRFKYGKVVATVYDIMPLAAPDCFPTRFVNRIQEIAPFWRDECARLICISEATRNDLERLLDIPRSKCVVVPPARHPHFRPPGADEVARVRKRYGLEGPYFMALGSVAPHKNLQGLCEAFAIAKQSTRMPHKLVIAGQPAWLIGDVLDRLEKGGLSTDLIFLGYAEWGDLPGLFGGAEAFCMPSLYEGYGLPVQEAMCCGCPVLLSDRTSLPEVAGDAGIYWNPDAAADMAACLRRIVEEDGLRDALRDRILGRADGFPDWTDIARKHIDLYQEVVANG